MSHIKITFLGGASAIGASCALLEIDNYTLLIDCGVRFDPKSPLPDLDRLTGKKLHAILVTHAHSDHTGALPIVHSSFPGVPILMTPPTIELVRILQKDALKLMDLAFAKEGEIPLYKEAQVESMLGQVSPIHYFDKWTLGDLEVRFLPSSHIVGSAMIHITTPKGNILFTGDYCVTAQKTVAALDRPPFPVDLLISEATYGARLHSNRHMAEQALISNICEVVMNGGRVLIPCFAIGRAQEVLLIVKQALREKKLPQIPVFVDGMVRHVCNVYAHHERYVSRQVLYEGRNGHVFYNRDIHPITTPQEREKVLKSGPCVIVASSGMLSGGPSAFYASHLAPSASDAIFITGYQDEESPGSALLDLANSPEKKGTIQLNEQSVAVQCRFDTYSLSAHADRMQICGLVSAFAPKTTVLVHGDAEAKQSLKESLPFSDVEVGWDGLVVEREYRSRSKSKPAAVPKVTVEKIQSLIAKEEGPFKLEVLAEALFGRSVSKQELAIFASEVETTGLLKRDDSKRNIFKRIKKVESSGASELIDAIKRENPKGKLNELCLKNKWPFPKKQLVQKQDNLYYCLLILVLGEKEFSSSQHSSKSKITAEQLAAKELLELITVYLQEKKEVVESEKVIEHSMETLPKWTIDKNAKPTINNYLQKGLLQSYECCPLKIEGPSHAPIFSMYAEAILKDGSTITSKTIQASNKKEAQALAATMLLDVLHSSEVFKKDVENSQEKKAKVVPSSRPKRIDDKTLAELVTVMQNYDCHHNCKLPFRYLRQLAKQAYRENKLADKPWIEEHLRALHKKWHQEKIELAQEQEYYPFIQLTLDSYTTLVKSYGNWALQLMGKHLDDPMCIFSHWAAQFAATLNKIGQEECEKHTDNLYKFVTTHKFWEQSTDAREEFKEAMATVKLQKLLNT